MKKVLGITAFVIVFAFAPMAMAQGESMYNTPAVGLPALNNVQTEDFQSISLQEAQKICDQVASANNQAKCTAVRNENTNPQTYHCSCTK